MRVINRFLISLPGLILGLSALTAAAADGVSGVSEPEFGIQVKETWISMADGVKLATDLFMPTGDVEGQQFPVILEYLPYRKSEGRSRSYSLYSYFVQRGYVLARVDIRGTGSSEGRLIPYEY